MVNVLLASVLVGLPAGAGACLFVNPKSHRDTAASLFLIVYAAALASVFALFNPHGTILVGAFWLKMPGAFVLGCLFGALVGWRQRRKGA